MRHDGYLALQGRVTDVINVQGSKLPPAPIEERLKEFLGVSDVCLFSRQAENGEERVHIVIEASAPVPQDRMSAAIARELHAFRGAYVHYVEAFPRNDLGKVVRETLRNQPWITNPQH